MQRLLRSLLVLSCFTGFISACGNSESESGLSAETEVSSKADFLKKMEARYGSVLVYSDFSLPEGYTWEEAYVDTVQAESLARQYLYRAKKQDANKDETTVRAALVSKAIMTLNDTNPNDLSWYNFRGLGRDVKGFLSATDNGFKPWRSLMVGLSLRTYDKEIFNRNAPWGSEPIKLPHWLDCIVDGSSGCN
ncbi:MAG: hypothetical protein EOP10_04465 [Proteobacteria bacterium]|nr:MAG: hypothetical protein EOP10_04465 [Pseudomonadota bacterium]